MCDKACYRSVSHIRKAFRRAGWRLRIYYCRECRYYHVTNTEKR